MSISRCPGLTTASSRRRRHEETIDSTLCSALALARFRPWSVPSGPIPLFLSGLSANQQGRLVDSLSGFSSIAVAIVFDTPVRFFGRKGESGLLGLGKGKPGGREFSFLLGSRLHIVHRVHTSRVPGSRALSLEASHCLVPFISSPTYPSTRQHVSRFPCWYVSLSPC